MFRLSTIQKRDNLNEVYRIGDISNGGAYHEYLIRSPEQSEATGDLASCRILFQKGARRDAGSQHGVIDEDLLEIVRDRLTCFQSGELATRENACALISCRSSGVEQPPRKRQGGGPNPSGSSIQTEAAQFQFSGLRTRETFYNRRL